MRKHPTGNCQCGAAETMTHIQCWCPQLRCNRIQVHHEIWRGICDSIVEATSQWCYLPEQEMGKRLPEAANGGAAADEWEAMRSALPSKLSKQRPDGLFIDWSSRTVVVGEFSRRMDRRPDECTEINTIKKTRYQALLESLALHLTGWTVLWAPFSVGVHGTVIKQDWTAALAALGVPHDKWESIMADAARKRSTAIELCSTAAERRLTIILIFWPERGETPPPALLGALRRQPPGGADATNLTRSTLIP